VLDLLYLFAGRGANRGVIVIFLGAIEGPDVRPWHCRLVNSDVCDEGCGGGEFGGPTVALLPFEASIRSHLQLPAVHNESQIEHDRLKFSASIVRQECFTTVKNTFYIQTRYFGASASAHDYQHAPLLHFLPSARQQSFKTRAILIMALFLPSFGFGSLFYGTSQLLAYDKGRADNTSQPVSLHSMQSAYCQKTDS
jgi:hypothetical protein